MFVRQRSRTCGELASQCEPAARISLAFINSDNLIINRLLASSGQMSARYVQEGKAKGA